MAYFDKYGVEFSDDRKTLIKCPEDFQGEYIIPEEVLFINEDAFRGCTQLKNINVSADNTRFCSIYGVLFNKDKTTLIRCPEGKLGNFIVPENTRIIGYSAFIDCKKFLNIVIVNTCIIKEWAFSGCSELRCIIFTSGIKNIGWNAFANCDNLSQISVPLNKKSCFTQFEGVKGLEDKIVECDIDGIGKTKYIFFDTETTGVPRNYKASMQDTDNWPRLVQLAWLLVDERGTELKRKSVIIRPDGFTIPEKAAQVHGITTERAQNEGLPLRNVLDEFMQDLELAEEIVGHNIDFDIHIVGAELCRLGLSTQKISNKPTTCTMKSFTNFCAIPSNNGYGGYKWPTLDELYCKVFGHGMENAHDALADILATKECFFELKNQFKAKASSVPANNKRADLSDLPF